MQGTYDIVLVIASYCVAVAAAYVAFDLAGRIAYFQGRRRWLWSITGSLAMGTGIWSAQVVGLTAQADVVAASVDPVITFVSWLAACGASFAALRVFSMSQLRRRSIVLAGALMGLGIVTVYACGMFAMHLGAAAVYNAALIAVSGLIVVIGASASLVVACRSSRMPDLQAAWGRLASALLMGFAVCAQHYIGIAAVGFPANAQTIVGNGLMISWMGLPVALTTCVILAAIVCLSILDAKRGSKRRAIIRARIEAERAHRLACYDSVTGLPNRSLFTEKLMKQLVSAHNVHGTHAPTGLVYAELRNYRSMADRLGTERMNRILKTLAVQLSRQMQNGDLLARLSTAGLILMVRERDSRSTQAALSAFSAQLSTPLHDGGETFRFTWDIGSSRYPENGNSTQSLIRAAMTVRQQIGAEVTTLAVSATPRYALAS